MKLAGQKSKQLNPTLVRGLILGGEYLVRLLIVSQRRLVIAKGSTTEATPDIKVIDSSFASSLACYL